MQTDSGMIPAARDTNFRPKYLGTEVIWRHAGVDTSVWMWTSVRWVKLLKTGDAGNAIWGGIQGLMSNQTDLQTALNGKLGNITNYIQAGANVGLSGLGTLASPYVISSSASGIGTVTQFGFTNGNGITGTVTNSTTTPTLSLGTGLNGIVNANGSGFGVVTIGSGLNYTGGVLTATGGTSLTGLISGNGTIFTTASIGAGLSFTANTLTNTITNTNQLTNGSGFITNVTGLVTAGSGVTITGSGTSGSPYVINSTGGGGGGTVTTVSAGTLSPLFTTTVTNPTTIPGISFTLSNATANSVFGNNTGSSAAPVYYVPTATTLNGWFSGTIVGLTSLSASMPLVYNSSTGAFTINLVSTFTDGYLRSIDYNTFIAKQASLTVTFTGTGAATYTGGTTLNIPNNLQTLTYAQNATNNTLALTAVTTQTLLTATTNLAGLLDTARTRFVDSLKNGLKTFTLYAANGLKASTVVLDSFYLGGPLNQNTLIATSGFTFSMTGLPNKSTALSTDSVLLIDNVGKWWKLAVPSGGGGAVASVSNSDGTITISPTTGSVVASLALGHANTWTGAMTVNAVLNLPGVTYSGGGSTFDVLVTDTGSSGKVWRQPYYQFDTTGFTGGATFVTFNGTKLVLAAGGSGVTTIGTFSGTSHANGASISGVTLTLSVADGTNPGMVSTTAQTIAGAKSFTSQSVFAAATTAAASLILTTSAGTNVTSPTSGMLWWNGTNLNFRTGSTTVDLLAGGGGAVSSVSNSDGTITISPTTGAVVASLALGHANTWTAAMTVNAAFTTNNSVTLSGLTYNAGGVKFDVLVQDTTTGILSRQPYYQFDTTGFNGGATIVTFNGTKLTLGTSGGGFTSPMTTAGDIIIENATPAAARLGIGSTGNILMVASGLPSWQAQTQITSLGTVGTGTWQGTLIAGQFGGTGVANTGKTITLGGNLTTSGAFTTTLTVTANTSVTLPISGTLYGTAAASITSAQLLSSVSDETGTGVAVFATTPTLVTPVLGVATATSVNKVAITAPTTSATLTLVTGSSLITAGAFATTLTATATTNSTLPAGTHTLAQLDGPAFSAATTTVPNMILTTSAGTNVTSPTSGMLWWNGTNLNFRTASSTVDLLGTVTSVGTFSSTSITNGASISGGVLTLGVGDQTNPGLISTAFQQLQGEKQFNSPVSLQAWGLREQNSGNSNETISVFNGVFNLFGSITANRTVTITPPTFTNTNVTLYYINVNTPVGSSFHWSPTNLVVDLNGGTISTFDDATSYVILYDGGFRVLQKHSVVGNNTVVGKGDLTSQTTGATIATYAVPGSGGFNTINVSTYLTMLAATVTDVMDLQVAYTDETSTSRTTVLVHVTSLTGTGPISTTPAVIRVKQGTTITLSTNITTGGGSVSYDAGGFIQVAY